MDVKKKDRILRKYFNPKKPAAFSGPQRLFKVLNKSYPGMFTINEITQWLSDQDAYSLQKPIRHRFKNANVRVTTINEQWDIDLLSMDNLAGDNDGVRFLLCAIDIFSRKLYIKPVKNKMAKSVLEAMKELLQEAKTVKMRADKGSEFVNQWFKKLIKQLGIYFFTTQNPTKANYVERVQRTIKTTIYRLMRHKQLQ